MAQLRGRAASPLRPGNVVKGILQGIQPIIPTGEITTEATIVDMHRTYKGLVKRENMTRSRANKLRGMTYKSFCTWFKFAQLLGLVEFIRELPMEFPPPGGNLLSLRKNHGSEVVVSTRRLFKLTSIGVKDEKSWTNLCKAWMEQWSAPQKVEYAPPYVSPPKEEAKPIEKVIKVPGVWAPFKKVERYSAHQAKLLLKHVDRLISAGIGAKGVRIEIDRLAGMIGDWTVGMEDTIDILKKARPVEEESTVKHEKLLKAINDLAEAFMDEDLKKAKSILEERL